MTRNESILSRELSVATREQIETASKLATIGWPWNRETVQKGTIRLYNDVTHEYLPEGRVKLKSILIAEIEPDGAVKMGDTCDGFSAREAAARKRARKAS